jgi:hypothetical protein
MVTMATELFCLNKLLEKFALLPCCVFVGCHTCYEILIQNTGQILVIFHNIKFFLKNYVLLSFFAVFNVLFVEYSLAKNNLNNT